MTIHDVLEQMAIVGSMYAVGMLTWMQAARIHVKLVRLYIRNHA